MKRRDFIACVGVGCLGSNLFIKVASSEEISDDWQVIGTIDQLDINGQLLNENSSIGAVLVVGNSQSENLIAINPSCTHMGCTVEWLAEEDIFLCPCHASEFDISGEAKMGPATKSLSSYAAKIEGDLVMVKRLGV